MRSIFLKREFAKGEGMPWLRTSAAPPASCIGARCRSRTIRAIPGSDELLAIGAPLGAAAGLAVMGIYHELLPPGRRTSWPHAERDLEEFVYVLEGRPQVWIDGEVHDLVPGDGVGFAKGTGIAHTFLNNTDADVRLLVIGERSRPAARSTIRCTRHAMPRSARATGWIGRRGRSGRTTACPIACATNAERTRGRDDAMPA